MTALAWMLVGWSGLGQEASPAPAGANAADEGKPLDLPIPLPVGLTAHDLRIPDWVEGQLRSQLKMASVKRLDDDHYQIQQLLIDLYKPDGKLDYKIHFPASTYDVKSRVIRSEGPVSISTEDFEVSGEKMDFDAQTRRGKLSGRVMMKIHNRRGFIPDKKAASGP